MSRAISAEALRRDVVHLAEAIGERNVWLPGKLEAAEEYIRSEFASAGLEVHREPYTAEGRQVANIFVDIPGSISPGEIIVVGAHYDSRCGMKARRSTKRVAGTPGTPGANDNASGIAGTLALARSFAGDRLAKTIRLIAFVNEEHPFFQTPLMGSWVHARGCRKRGENIAGMISLENFGFYSHEPRSQTAPFPLSLFVPGVGDFVAFLSNRRSRAWVKKFESRFKAACAFPSRTFMVPELIKRFGWSDDWAFWQEGFPGFSVTDTAFLRYRHYHTVEDTPDKLNYQAMAEIMKGVEAALRAAGERS